MRELTLYHSPTACSTAPFILLCEAGAEFSVEPVDLRKGQQKQSDFLRLNPKGKVPVLVVDGNPLTENLAIQVWIARMFPVAHLLPRELIQECQAISLMTWWATGLHPFITPQVRPERYCDLPCSEDSVRRCTQIPLLNGLKLANDMLVGREWFFDHFTAPDAYFFWALRRAQQVGVDTALLVNCTAHLERVQNRPSVQRALEWEARHLSAS